MNTKAKFHPSSELLNDFVIGNLSAGVCVAISAHIEMCTHCREITQALEDEISSAWSDPEVEFDTDNYSEMISKIVSQAQEVKSDESLPMIKELHLNSRAISLPGVLAKAASSGLHWKKLGGGISQASIAIDNETHCEFIYMSPGSKTPVHSHKGSEVTLVLDGNFNDELGDYMPADFLLRDHDDVHQPSSEDGCLCFAVTDSPLRFTQGLARLLNPWNSYRFNKNITSN